MERQFRKGPVTFKAGKRPKHEPENPIRSGIEALEIVSFPCCKRTAKVKPILSMTGCYCPFCGVKIMKLNRADLRKIMYDFNSISSRLLQADFNDYTNVLSKFIAFIKNTPIIIDYIIACGVCDQDLKQEFDEVSRSYGRCIFLLEIQMKKRFEMSLQS